MTRRRIGFLAERLATREQAHRRRVLVGLGAIILLSVSPVVAHHVAERADLAIRGIDHLGVLCLTALHHLLAPIHRLFHLLLAAGLVYALVDRARAWLHLRRLLAQLDASVPRTDDPFWTAATRAGVDPAGVRVVDDLPVPAFTSGWTRPVIYAARVLSSRLTSDQLAAVLAHEGAHVARRDPLRLSLMRVFACTLFWLPALRRLADDMADEAEIEADDVAAGERPLVLASAILALAEWATSHRMSAAVVRFHHQDLVARRVRRLAGEPVAPTSRLTRRSLIGAGAALALVWASGVMMVHPLPDASHADHAASHHCDHPGFAPVAHLFCLGRATLSPGEDCPHGA